MENKTLGRIANGIAVVGTLLALSTPILYFNFVKNGRKKIGRLC